MSSSLASVLVTGAGSHAGSSVCHQLRTLCPDVTIVATDTRPATADVDTFVVGHSAASPEYLPFLRSLIAQHSVDLLIPTGQEELRVLAAHRAELGVPVIMPDHTAVELCGNELLTRRFLAVAGVTVPENGDGVAASREKSPTPGAAMISRDRVPGAEYRPQAYRSPLHDGEIITVVLEKTGAASLRRIPTSRATDIEELVHNTIRALGLYGPINLHVCRDRSGRPAVLQVNAGFGTESVHAPELLDTLLADAEHLSLATSGQRV